MLVKNQVLRGRKFVYCLVEQIKTKESVQSTLWKAETIHSANYTRPANLPANLAIVKTATWDRYHWLGRERLAYQQPSIKNSPYIRTMYDEIHDFKHKKDFDTEDGFKDAVQKEPYCLVLEYLSYPLEALDPERYKQNPVFMAAFFKSMLIGTRSLKEAEAIWSDGKLENMLCSNVDSSSPDIKISDLGLCGPEGYDDELLQPFKTRAPEVWAGLGCGHVADIWSIAAAFICWIDRTILGPSDMKEGINVEEAWCIAKIIRGFETDKDKMPAASKKAADGVQRFNRLGRLLLTQKNDGTPESMHVPTRPFFDEVLPELGLLPQVEGLLRKMLVLNHEKRSTAEALLDSKEFADLLAAANLSTVNVPTGDHSQSELTSLLGNVQLA